MKESRVREIVRSELGIRENPNLGWLDAVEALKNTDIPEISRFVAALEISRVPIFPVYEAMVNVHHIIKRYEVKEEA